MIKINIYKQDKIWQEYKQKVGAAFTLCIYIVQFIVYSGFTFSLLSEFTSTDKK